MLFPIPLPVLSVAQVKAVEPSLGHSSPRIAIGGNYRHDEALR